MFARTTSKLTAALVAVAAAVPATAAAQSPGTGYIFASAPGKDYSSLSASAPVATTDAGFQWGDAGIGAAAALVLIGCGTAGVARVRHGAA